MPAPFLFVPKGTDMDVPTTRLHLCQPDASKSCGACCGLYNWENHTRPAVQSLLERRTGLFSSLLRCGDVERYRRKAWMLNPGPKLCEAIYNCEFLGFTDDAQRRVGCLLHPSLHQGTDLRGHSFYGAELCANHYCIGFGCLTPVEQRAVVLSLDDWYLYGLVVTDIDLVKSFITHAENRLGDRVRCEPLGHGRVQETLRDFFRLKEEWKYTSGEKRMGKYYFSRGEYYCARIDYEKRWGRVPSRYDRILVSLSSGFNSTGELQEAEAVIEERLERFVEAYREARETG